MEMHSYSSKCPFASLEDIKDKHVTVMGLGLNGGGEASVRFFLRHGAFVTVTDKKTESDLAQTIKRLNDDASLDKSRLTYHLGNHLIEDFKNADCVIKNPGVKFNGNEYLAAAKAVETDLSIFLRFTDCPIIAVTGSKGKSSTVSSIYYGLKTAGFKCFLGGNITVSPLTFIDEVNSDTPVIIEFSSWQLADLRGRGILKPYISIITKIVPDHQNWYGNMEDYVADKRLIYANQTKGDYSIFDYGEDEPGTGPASGGTWGDCFANESKATVFRYFDKPFELRSQENSSDKKVFGVWQDKDENGNFCGKILLPNMEKPEIILKNLAVPGEHNKANVLNAAFVMYLMGVNAERIIEICAGWQGIEHRLQFFWEWKNEAGVDFKFYNDSCATVPEAAAAAVMAFEKPVTLVTGGTDKGLSLKPLADALSSKKYTESLYLLDGTATEKLVPSLQNAGVEFNGPYKSLDELFARMKELFLKENSGVSKIVVFSPGATSFGMFKNEFDRGEQFMAGVKKWFEK